ncbi:hypothetical protein ACFFF7_07210 [Novosphingobium aquiterrae]|uniref:Phytoene synthase n=1 Tax=Novosphingobium aquiterrae TaxID=624388 RepID=A0ABV6PIG6_9SPHN
MEQRLALSYAPAAVRRTVLAVMALDARMSNVVVGAREPIMGQIRLAWWRERLREVRSDQRGEPLLDFVSDCAVDPLVLTGLIDGWERLLGDPDAAALEALAAARSLALASVAETDAGNGAALRTGREWALADLGRLPDTWGRLALALSDSQTWAPARLPRRLRHMAVLHALARTGRASRRGRNAGSVLVAVRVGLLGI